MDKVSVSGEAMLIRRFVPDATIEVIIPVVLMMPENIFAYYTSDQIYWLHIGWQISL